MAKAAGSAPPTARLHHLTRHLAPAPVVSTARINRKVVVRAIPQGEPAASDFEIVTEALPALADGEMLLKTKWLTLDPYMRTEEGMSDQSALGRVMIGGTVSEVLESRADGWRSGDLCVGYYGWQEYAVARPGDVQWNHPKWPIEKWDLALGKPSAALGVLGMTGYTAYFGLLEVGRPRPGETVVVSAASGAVGSVVGQLAKIRGCRVVGVAGGPRKCAYCVEELGFDACVDYKADNLAQSLSAATPKGIDVYFENVGGAVLEAVVPLLNGGCRIPVCGFISQYNGGSGTSPLKRLKELGIPKMSKGAEGSGFRFFMFAEWVPRFPEAMRDLSQWVREGKIKDRESVTEGLDNSVSAFVGMLRGENFGKTLIKVT